MPYDSENYQPAAPVDLTEPWRKVLMDAADYIEAHGWCQGTLGAADGARCALGAITILEDDNAPHAWMMLGKFLRVAYIPGWNDAPGRTAAEVCDALRSCARS